MKHRPTQREKGAVLLTTLAFLAIITMISLAGMRSSSVELRLASNHEAGLAAAQIAQAAVDAAINDDSNFIVTGTDGTTNTNVPLSGVDGFSSTQIEITELGRFGPPRGSGLSADKFSTALFSVDSSYNSVSTGRGQAQIVQGYMMLVSQSSQSNQ